MTFPANYAVMAEDELTYVTGVGAQCPRRGREKRGGNPYE